MELWIPITIAAAFLQNLRSVGQKHLKSVMGTTGATFVRFGFGLPVAALFVLGLNRLAGFPFPHPGPVFLGWMTLGAFSQIGATFLLIHLFSFRNFAVGTAYSRTEPVQAALFGLVFLGDVVTPGMAAAILIATSGVVTMALKPGTSMDVRATLLGLAAGAMFALSAVGFRGAILSLGLPSYVMAATFTLVVGLVMQSALLSLFLWVRNPDVLVSIMRAWRPSLFAGFMGALASQFWFLAFALATAASVRTLALVEVLFAQAISRFAFKQATTPREAIGVVLIVVGVLLLLWTG